MKILIATDGRQYSNKAIKFAGYLFQKKNPIFHVIHVHSSKNAPGTKKIAKGYLERAKDILAQFGVIPKLIMVEGEIVEEILKELKRDDYDLLVIGSKRATRMIEDVLAEMILERPITELAKMAEISLLVVKDPPNVLNQVLLCTDGSPFAEAAVNFWSRLPKAHEPRVVVLNIIPQLFSRFSSELKSVTPDLLKVLARIPGKRTAVMNRAKDILEKYGIEVKIKLRECEYAAEEILKEEEEGDYDLIVMGYRGTKYRSKTKAGSQSLAVVKRSCTSVLVYQF